MRSEGGEHMVHGHMPTSRPGMLDMLGREGEGWEPTLLHSFNSPTVIPDDSFH